MKATQKEIFAILNEFGIQLSSEDQRIIEL